MIGRPLRINFICLLLKCICFGAFWIDSYWNAPLTIWLFPPLILLIHSFIHSFIYLFIHSFIHPFTEADCHKDIEAPLEHHSYLPMHSSTSITTSRWIELLPIFAAKECAAHSFRYSHKESIHNYPISSTFVIFLEVSRTF